MSLANLEDDDDTPIPAATTRTTTRKDLNETEQATLSEFAEQNWGHTGLTVRQKLFIAAYVRLGGNVTGAARVTKIRRNTHYLWMESKEEYKQAIEDSANLVIDLMEAEADRRGIEGIDDPIFGKDGVIGHKRKFSDTLLLARLKAVAPEKYSTRSNVVHSGTVDHSIHIDAAELRAALCDSLDSFTSALERRNAAIANPQGLLDVVDAELVE
jgi:hypothetical protein